VVVDPELKSLTDTVNGFSGWNHADRIRFFAWFQHVVKHKDTFTTGDIADCYDSFGYDKPNISQFLKDMANRKPPVFLRRGQEFLLEGKLRSEYDEKYGEHDITLNIRQLITDLPNKIPDVAEKDFMKEALICLRHDAARAAIIMVWNIAYYHLCIYVLKHKLKEFNDTYPKRFAKKWKDASVQVITNYDDFAVDLKESETIEICNSALIITNDQYKILKEKLGKRNSAAHPSQSKMSQVQAEAFIDELITNVVSQLTI
jgi:hypothetical protein